MLDWLRRLFGLGPPPPRAARTTPADRPPPPAPSPPPRAEPDPPPPPPPPAEPEHGRSVRGRFVRVHADRLDDRPAPRPLTPSEALRLAREGPGALEREPGDG